MIKKNKLISTVIVISILMICFASCSKNVENNINSSKDNLDIQYDNDENNYDVEEMIDEVATDFEWEITDDGTLIVSGHGAMPNWSMENKMPWIDNRNSIKNIKIEEGLTTIGRSAFNGCTKVTDIQIPDTVVKIKEGAIACCSSLTSVNIPSNVKYIEEKVFACCTNLKEITLNDGLYSIGQEAFESCTNLAKIEIPSTVKHIDGGVFSGCHILSNVIINENSGYIFEDGILYNAEKTILISCLSNKTGDLIIPESIKEISNAAFDGCNDLTSIVLPNGLVKIGDESFKHCTRIKQIKIPSSVTEIGEDAFYVLGSNMIIIKGQEGSVAEQYAIDNELLFENV